MNTRTEGLIRKFKVERLTPSSRGIDHDDCQYFVLDITHDPHARNAALAYAESCEPEYPHLAADLRAAVSAITDLGLTLGLTPAPDRRPHSRACGIRRHPHGPECHSNCPTCGGNS